MGLTTKTYDLVCFFSIIVLAVLFLYIGNKIATDGLPVLYDNENNQTFEAEVVKILSASDKEITFEATAEGMENESIIAVQNIEVGAKAAEAGDKVIISNYSDSGWYFVDYIRIDKIILYACLFIAALFIFGRIKGLKTILSLGLTCVSILAIFIPAFMSGKNIYIATFVVCMFSIVVALFIVNGVNKKTFAAITGCFGGVLIAGILTFFMNDALDLRGFINEDRNFLLNLPTGASYALKDVIFAGILMGAVGAATDVAMSISSGLWELKCNAPEMTFREYIKSGINIGQDIVCTMTNTLVLAYIGSSLAIVLILMFYVNSFFEFINNDSVIIQLFQSIAGSFGILATMPLTALICAVLYTRTEKRGILE